MIATLNKNQDKDETNIHIISMFNTCLVVPSLYVQFRSFKLLNKTRQFLFPLRVSTDHTIRMKK